jgi:hypothetical protein
VQFWTAKNPHVFPKTELSALNRLRAHPSADVLGHTFTTYFDKQPLDPLDYPLLSASDWVATSILNVETGENFASWAEFFSPYPYNGDQFTSTVCAPWKPPRLAQLTKIQPLAKVSRILGVARFLLARVSRNLPGNVDIWQLTFK